MGLRASLCVFVLNLKYLGLYFKQVSMFILKELGSHPKVFIWDGEGKSLWRQ